MIGKVEVVGFVGVCPVSRATIEATVIRADGTVEELGVIADSGLLFAPQQRRGILQCAKDFLSWLKR